MMLKIPLTENVWGDLWTSENNHFVITYDAISKKYILYVIQDKEYTKLASSYQAINLLHIIDDYDTTHRKEERHFANSKPEN